MTTYEQPQLPFPVSQTHGVLVEIGGVPERFSAAGETQAETLAGSIIDAHEQAGVVFKDGPDTTGWYGLGKGGTVYRVAAY